MSAQCLPSARQIGHGCGILRTCRTTISRLSLTAPPAATFYSVGQPWLEKAADPLQFAVPIELGHEFELPAEIAIELRPADMPPAQLNKQLERGSHVAWMTGELAISKAEALANQRSPSFHDVFPSSPLRRRKLSCVRRCSRVVAWGVYKLHFAARRSASYRGMDMRGEAAAERRQRSSLVATPSRTITQVLAGER